MSKNLSLASRLTPILPHGFALPLSPRLARRVPSSSPREPGLPFFGDPTHTIPTRRLFRHLLRRTASAPSASRGPAEDGVPSEKGVRWALTKEWRSHRPVTSIPRVRTFLAGQLDLLSRLSSTSPGEVESAKAELESIRSRWQRKTAREASEAIKRSHAVPGRNQKGMLTGAFLRPSLFNPPLPRLHLQPERISMMIHNRLRARENRQAKLRDVQDWGRDMKHEMEFYRDVHTPPPKRRGTRFIARDIRRVEVGGVDAEFMGGWDTEFNRTWNIYQARYEREHARSEEKFPLDLIERVQKARKRRDESKRDRAERRKQRSVSPPLDPPAEDSTM